MIAEPPAVPAPQQQPAPQPVARQNGDSPRFAHDLSGQVLSPVVRKMINEHGLDPRDVVGTGPNGRITRDDVQSVIDRRGSATRQSGSTEPAATTAPTASATSVASSLSVSPPPVTIGSRAEVVPLSKIRRLTGAHMVMSKSVSPHAFSVVEVDYANVDVVRNATKAEFRSSEGFSLTYLPFISRAVVDALMEFPHMNASVDGDNLVVHKFVDLGVAVDLDYNGLIVPVVRDAETKRLRAIAREINDLAVRARSRKLSPDEIQGGTFTISNNGSAGSVLTMAVINQPQVAIISTDAIVRKPVVVTSAGGDEGIAIHPVGNLAMSWDHRAFDGAYAANFLARVKEIIESRDWSAEV